MFRKRKIFGVLILALVVVLISLLGVPLIPTVQAAAYTGPTGGKFLAPIDSPVAGSVPISTKAQLEAIQNNPDWDYHLTADIDLSGTAWAPIGGDSSNAFTGTFNGQGYVIRGLRITGNQRQYTGLFGHARDATIKNLGLEEIFINNTSTVSYSGGIYSCGSGNNKISNCYTTGDIYASGNSSYAGGICGDGTGSISYCYNTAYVYASSLYWTYAGGISGYGNSKVSYSYNGGIVRANNPTTTTPTGSYTSWRVCAGGIYGQSTANTNISDCYNTGKVSVTSASSVSRSSSFAGGISGYSGSNSNITNCNNSGVVSSAGSLIAYAGGINGLSSSNGNSFLYCHNTGAVTASNTNTSARVQGVNYYTYAGGILGVGSGISYCYNTGAVTASYNSTTVSPYLYAGGLCGQLSGNGASNSYNTGIVSVYGEGYSITNSFAGGLCGQSSASISKCYNTGNVGAFCSGSFSMYAYAGGLSGHSSASISECYNTGNVSANSGTGSNSSAYAGGIYGDSSSIINRCYWNIDSAQTVKGIAQSNANKKGVGTNASTIIPSLTTAQMKEQDSFSGFDFDTVWFFKNGVNDNYPVLQVFHEEPETYKVTFNVLGGNGKITAMANSVTISSGASMEQGDTVVFTASPNNGYRVKEWTDNGAVVNGTKLSYTVLSIATTHDIMIEFDSISEPTPTAAIDYLNETLVGLNGSYSINGGAAVTITDAYSIDPGWFGKTINIVKKGNGTETTDSNQQSLNISARPAIPNPGHTNCTTEQNNDGSITNVTAAMEYQTNGDTGWTSIIGTSLNELMPEVYYVRVKGTSSSFKSNSTAVTIGAFDATPETKPCAAIDYINETLVGLNGSYSINGEAAINITDAYPLDLNWFGQTIHIIKKGNGTETTDSDQQNLDIPTRPTVPNVTAIQPTVVGSTGGINDTTAAMEYRLGTTGAWTTCTASNTIGLVIGTYQVRLKATDSNFASAVATVTVEFRLIQTNTKSITSFTLAGVVGTINESAGTITLTVPAGTNVTNQRPNITHTGVNLIPAIGVVQNFTNPVSYTVIAADYSTKTYIVTVKIGGGNTNTAAPNITVQPSNRMVDRNKSAVLTIRASVSKGSLSYQWYSVSNNRNNGGTVINGAKSATYNAPTNAVGTRFYYCVVNNTDKTATGNKIAIRTSNVVSVTVKRAQAVKPSIKKQPKGKSLRQKAKYTLTITAKATPGNLTFQWYRSSKQNSGFKKVSGAVGRKASYRVPTNKKGMVYYRCVVTNTDRNATKTQNKATSKTAKVTVK